MVQRDHRVRKTQMDFSTTLTNLNGRIRTLSDRISDLRADRKATNNPRRRSSLTSRIETLQAKRDGLKTGRDLLTGMDVEGPMVLEVPVPVPVYVDRVVEVPVVATVVRYVDCGGLLQPDSFVSGLGASQVPLVPAGPLDFSVPSSPL